MVVALYVTARSLRVEPPRTVILPLLDYPLPEICNFRRIFEMDCPGCGMTRSFIFMSRLRCSEAWQLNPAGALLFASLMVSIPLRSLQWFRARQGRALHSTFALEAGWLIVIAGLMMLDWAFTLFS